MLYQAVHTRSAGDAPPRDIVRQPELARYVEGWGRVGDVGFVAHDPETGMLLGAVWLRVPPADTRTAPPPYEATPELAFAVTMGQRGRGIGTALLTHLVRATPDQSTLSLNASAGQPVLRLYERFGFRKVAQHGDIIIMSREG